MNSPIWFILHFLVLLVLIMCLISVVGNLTAILKARKDMHAELRLGMNATLLLGLFLLHLLFWAQETHMLEIFPGEIVTFGFVRLSVSTPVVSIVLAIYSNKLTKNSLAS